MSFSIEHDLQDFTPHSPPQAHTAPRRKQRDHIPGNSNTDLEAIPPARKKRRLEYIKCDQCRKDKKKCLPVDRQWPEKCQHCIQNEFGCSEGKRANANRKPERVEPDNRQCSEPSKISTQPHPISNEKFHDLILLAQYRNNISMAVSCLYGLKQEIKNSATSSRDCLLS